MRRTSNFSLLQIQILMVMIENPDAEINSLYLRRHIHRSALSGYQNALVTLERKGLTKSRKEMAVGAVYKRLYRLISLEEAKKVINHELRFLKVKPYPEVANER